jgi:alginate O-acetyltransferase complex protein AlgI
MFRADSVNSAFLIIKAMFGGNGIVLPLKFQFLSPALDVLGVKYGVFEIIRLFMMQIPLIPIFIIALLLIPNPQQLMRSFNPNYKWAITLAAIFVFCLLKLSNVTEFLYFQF